MGSRSTSVSNELKFDNVTYDGQFRLNSQSHHNDSDEIIDQEGDEDSEPTEHTPQTNAILAKSK